MKRLFTSESVTEGHPDKICDQISDAIVDAILAKDPQGRVAAETTVNTGYAMVMGESTDYLWILSRDKTIPKDVLDDFIATAKQIGVDTDNFI